MAFQTAYIASLAAVFQSLGTPIPLANIVIFSITESTRRLDALNTEVYDGISTSKLGYSGSEMDRTTLDGLIGEDEMGRNSKENNNNGNLLVNRGEQQHMVDSKEQIMDSSTSHRQHLLRSRYLPYYPPHHHHHKQLTAFSSDC